MRESIALRFAVLDPMEIVDFGGLDTFGRVWANAFPDLAAGGSVPAFVERLVADGAVGVKAGRGPASKIVEAPKLVHPLAQVEIELVAIRDK